MPISAQEMIDAAALVKEINEASTLHILYSGVDYAYHFNKGADAAARANALSVSRDLDSSGSFGGASGTATKVDFKALQLTISQAGGKERALALDYIYQINEREFSLRALKAAWETLSAKILNSATGLTEDMTPVPEPDTSSSKAGFSPAFDLELGFKLTTFPDDTLPDMSGFERAESGPPDTSWVSPGYILGDRDLDKGETLYAYLVRVSDGALLEMISYTPTDAERPSSKWPRAFAEAINAQGKDIKAGKWVARIFNLLPTIRSGFGTGRIAYGRLLPL